MWRSLESTSVPSISKMTALRSLRWRGMDERVSSRVPALEPLPIPLRAIRRGLVRALEKLEQRVVGRLRFADRVVRQHELAQLLAVERFARPQRCAAEAFRFGIGVAVVKRKRM